MTIWRMSVACWIPRATDAHSGKYRNLTFCLATSDSSSNPDMFLNQDRLFISVTQETTRVNTASINGSDVYNRERVFNESKHN